MNPNRSDYKRDIKLVDQTLLNLIKGRLFMLIIVCGLILGALYFVAKKILSFGQSLDYSFLNGTAIDVIVEYLEKYDVFFWWAIVIIIALITLSFINNLIRKTLDRYSQTNIPMFSAHRLITNLSPMALEVLAWVWVDRREPLKVNDIKQLSHELKGRRFSHIEDAREQERLLNEGIYGPIDETQPSTDIILESEEPRLDETAHVKNETDQQHSQDLIIKDEPRA